MYSRILLCLSAFALATIIGCQKSAKLETEFAKQEQQPHSFPQLIDANAQPEPAEEKSIREFLERAGAAFKSGDGEKLAEVLSLGDAIQLLKDEGRVAGDYEPPTSKLKSSYSGMAFFSSMGFWWDEVNVLFVQDDEHGRKFVDASARIRSEARLQIEFRLVPLRDTWQIADFQLQSQKMPFAMAFAGGLKGTERSTNPASEKFIKVFSEFYLTQEIDSDALDEINSDELSDTMRVTYFNLKTMIHFDDGRWAMAKKSALKSLDLSPNQPKIQLEYVNSLINLGEYKKALDESDRYAELARKDCRYYLARGQAFTFLEDYEAAATSYLNGLNYNNRSLNLMAWLLDMFYMLEIPREHELEVILPYYKLVNQKESARKLTDFLKRNSHSSLPLGLLRDLHRAAFPDDEAGINYVYRNWVGYRHDDK